MSFYSSFVRVPALFFLASMLLAGCQDGQKKEDACRPEPEVEAVLLEAVLAQQAFYETAGEELRAEYDKVVDQYPLMRRYVTLQEVVFALYAMTVVVPEHDIDCMTYRMLTSPGNTIWFSLCRDDLFTPDFECISACLDCLKTARLMSCLQHCGCLKRIDEGDQ